MLELADLAALTDRNTQTCYHRMFMGAVAAFRNPRAHEVFAPLDENEALEQLGFASLLMRRLDEADSRAGTGN